MRTARRLSTLALASLTLGGCAAPRPVEATAARRMASSRAAAAPVARRAEQTEATGPAMPDGWFVPAGLAPMVGPKPGTFKARLAALAAERRVAPVRVDVAALPLAEVEPDPDLRVEPKEPPALPRAHEVLTLGWRVVVRDKRFGKIRVNWDSEPFFAYAEAGAGPGRSHGIASMAWTALSVLPDGTAEIEEMHGWYDIERKNAYAVARRKTRAASLLDGLAFGYRSTCPKCMDSPDKLHLFVPSGGRWDSPFQHVTMDLGAAAGSSFTATISPDAIATWRRSGANPKATRNVKLGFEVTRADGDPAPILLAFAGEVTL